MVVNSVVFLIVPFIIVDGVVDMFTDVDVVYVNVVAPAYKK